MKDSLLHPINNRKSVSPNLFLYIFLGSLLVTLIVIHPVLFLNDEWITANQVAQLSKGSQILINEGKYGTYENKTPYAYFEARHNTLPYTSYLPLFSTPLLWILMAIGDHLPYLIISFWISLALFLFLLLGRNINYQAFPIFHHFTSIIPACILLFFGLNLITYAPLSLSGKTDSPEVLAVVFLHIIVYSCFAGTIFLIANALFSHSSEKKWGFVVLICCSSALFWTNTLKDHLDVMFFGALLVYSIICHIKTEDAWYGVCSFIISGIIVWIRPEAGAFTMISLLIVYYPITVLTNRSLWTTDFIILLLSPIFSIIGAIPLLLNNLLVMGNILKFPWQMAGNYQAIYTGNMTSVATPSSDSGSFFGNETIHHIITIFMHRLTIDDNFFPGLFSVFFAPESLKVPVFGIIPLFLLGILLVPILAVHGKKRFSREEIKIMLIMVSLAGATTVAYISSIGGLGISIGIYPDVRYLSPVYLPLTLIGIMILLKFDIPHETITAISRNTLLISGAGIFMLLAAISFFYPELAYSDFFLWINVITTLLVFGTIGIIFILFILSIPGIIAEKWRYVPLPLLIALPLVWQISQVILLNFSGGHLEQFSPLLPAVSSLFEYLSGAHP